MTQGNVQGANVNVQIATSDADSQQLISVPTVISSRTAAIRMTGPAVSKRNTIMKSCESLGGTTFDLTRLSIRSEVISCSDQ